MPVFTLIATGRRHWYGTGKYSFTKKHCIALIKRVKSSGLAGSGRKRAGKGIGGIWKRKAEMEDDLA